MRQRVRRTRSSRRRSIRRESRDAGESAPGRAPTPRRLREAASRGLDTLIVGEGPHHTAIEAARAWNRRAVRRSLRHRNARRARPRRRSRRRSSACRRRSSTCRAVCERRDGARSERVALALTGVSKRFGATQALRRRVVSRSTRNGARAPRRKRRGKVDARCGSRSGSSAPTPGPSSPATRLDRFSRPRRAMAAGVGMVHQHFTNVPAMTVAENVALGARGAYSTRSAPRRRCSRSANAPAWRSTRIPSRARCPSARSNASRSSRHSRATRRRLLLDEPTAVLAPAEAAELLAWLREFANRRRKRRAHHARAPRSPGDRRRRDRVCGVARRS